MTGSRFECQEGLRSSSAACVGRSEVERQFSAGNEIAGGLASDAAKGVGRGQGGCVTRDGPGTGVMRVSRW